MTKMSFAKTLTLSSEQLLDSSGGHSGGGGHSRGHSRSNSASTSTAAAYFHHFSSVPEREAQTFQLLPKEDTVLLDKLSTQLMSASNNTVLQRGALHKSNSYSGGNNNFYPKAVTILKQDSLNGRIAISLTNDSVVDSEYGTLISSTIPLTIADYDNDANAADSFEESEPFLHSNSSNVIAALSNSSTNNSNASNRRSTRSICGAAKTRNGSSKCQRLYGFMNRNWYLSYLVSFSILLALIFIAYLTRNYAERLLYWVETQNPWVTFSFFMLLFILVSFPVIVGYFVLMITAGYLFGCLKGFATVILGANLGIAIAHTTMRSLRHRIPMHKLIKNETGRAILRVISGPKAFKIVLFTRLTPLPFGIQNAIFGISSIDAYTYYIATVLGLLPAQTINVYLGSTLRSMHEVLNQHGGGTTAITGYISFAIEVVCGVALMLWVVQKARKELSETLLSVACNDGKLINIQV